MNAGRDVERLIADWLVEEAAPGAPDRALDAVRTTVERTRQRRELAAWRDHMSTTMTRLGGVAAAIIVAVAAWTWIAGQIGPDVGGVTPSPSTVSSSPAPTGTFGPISTTVRPLSVGALEPGTYRIADPFLLTITATFPSAGWAVWSPTISADAVPFYKRTPDPPNVGIVIADVHNVYADPCSPLDGLLEPPLGPTVDDLVTALAGQPATEATTPNDVTVSGYKGKHLEYTFTSEGACPRMSRWPSDLGDREAIPSEHDEVWILDVGGTRLVIDIFSFSNSTAEDIQEARGIVEGMIITP